MVDVLVRTPNTRSTRTGYGRISSRRRLPRPKLLGTTATAAATEAATAAATTAAASTAATTAATSAATGHRQIVLEQMTDDDNDENDLLMDLFGS